MHSSPIPLALAPRGFRCRGHCPVKRVTVAFGGADDRLVVGAAEVAERVGASLRVASFAVRPRTPIQAGVGREGDGRSRPSGSATSARRSATTTSW